MANKKNNLSDKEVKKAAGGAVKEFKDGIKVFDDDTEKRLKVYTVDVLNNEKARAYNRGYHEGKHSMDDYKNGYNEGLAYVKKLKAEGSLKK